MVKQRIGGFPITHTVWTGLFGFALILTVFSVSLALPVKAIAREVDPELMEQFEANETTGYVIYFRAQANLSGAPKTDWKEQSEFINRVLQENAKQSQARVRSYLFDRRVSHRSFWKDNTIVVDRSDRETFDGLQSFAEIEAIRILKAGPKGQSRNAPAEKESSAIATKP